MRPAHGFGDAAPILIQMARPPISADWSACTSAGSSRPQTNYTSIFGLNGRSFRGSSTSPRFQRDRPGSVKGPPLKSADAASVQGAVRELLNEGGRDASQTPGAVRGATYMPVGGLRRAAPRSSWRRPRRG